VVKSVTDLVAIEKSGVESLAFGVKLISIRLATPDPGLVTI